MNARETILNRLRATQTQAHNSPDIAAFYASQHKSLNTLNTQAEKVAKFRHMLEAAHAQVVDVSPDTLATTLGKLVAEKQLGSVACGTLMLNHSALTNSLKEACTLHVYDEYSAAEKHLLFNDVDAGVTFARSGIAQTGTLILWPHEHEPRLLSLVPPLHIAIVDAASLHATFYDAMVNEGWANGMPTNALLISGPSKTADIQQTLAYGAHGPKEVIVLLVNDNSAQNNAGAAA